MYCVYVIKSFKDHKYYIGYTNNLERRLQDHNRGKSKSIKYTGPFQLTYSEEYRTKIQAIQRERQIKKYKGGAAFQRLISK